MKALGSKTLKQKVMRETDKYMQENYKQLSYQAICQQAPTIMQQTEAAMLYAMHLHGFSAKTISKYHNWYCAIMRMPAKAMGKTPKMYDILEFMKKTYGIDFTEIKPNFPSFEEYDSDEN